MGPLYHREFLPWGNSAHPRSLMPSLMNTVELLENEASKFTSLGNYL